MAARKLRRRKDGVRQVNDEDAFWQYLLDHARPHKDGHLSINLSLRDRDHWVHSLNARRNGLYRYTEEEVRAHNPLKARKAPKGGLRRKVRRFLHWLSVNI